MGTAVLAVLSVLVQAPAPLYQEPLTGLPSGWAVAGDWAVMRGSWQPGAEGLVSGTDDNLAVLQAVPSLEAGRAQVTVRPERRTRPDGWVVATLTLYDRADRFWQLALVEDPDGTTRRLELLESLDGTWQAQSAEGSRLPSRTEGGGRWEYGQAYDLELSWDPGQVAGRIRPAGSERWQWQTSYTVAPAARAVTRGRPALRTDGMVARYANLTVDGTAPSTARRGQRAVLLDGPGPWVAGNWRSAADALERLLRDSGYQVRRVAPPDLPTALDETQDAVLAAPSLELLPRPTAERIIRFQQQGGSLLATGGEPFREVLYGAGGEWQTRAALMQHVTPSHIIFEPARVRGLQRGTNAPEPAPVINYGATGPTGQADALQVKVPKLTGWDTLAVPAFAQSPYGPNDTLTIVPVRGTAGQAITMEWKEADGSRWIARVPLQDGWSNVVLEPSDFHFWPDGSPPERATTSFNPRNARTLSFGPATGQGADAGKEIDYSLGPIGVAEAPVRDGAWAQPVIETFSPWYKQWPSTRENATVRVPITRARGLTAAPETEGRYSTVGPLFQPVATRYVAASGSSLVWLPSVTLSDADRTAVTTLLKQSRRGVFLLNGGAQSVVVDAGQPVELAARLMNASPEPADLTVRWTVRRGTDSVVNREASLRLAGGATRGALAPQPQPLPEGEYRVETRVEAGGELLDRVEGWLRVPPAQVPAGDRIRVENGQFTLGGKRLFLHGVNYYPRYVSGEEPARYRSHWLSPRNYDPEVVEADLAAIEALGMNLISVQYSGADKAGPVRDLLERARRHHLYVNLYLSGAHPLGFDPQQVTAEIRDARLPGNPAVFGYDLAWEPKLGDHNERVGRDPAWRQWVNEQYGSLAAAETAWGIKAPRDAKGELTNPTDDMIRQDGPHRVFVAAYRRFVDDLVSRGYRRVTALVRQLDPDALLGARTGYGGTGRVWANVVLAYDLLAGAAWLDFTSPEGYGLPPTFEAGRHTGFITAYGRWAGNGKPVFWCEFGSSIGPRGGSSESRQHQEQIWETMLRVASDSGANATAGWWWPGGWRVDESSDYGIFSPDGMPRASARVGANLGKQIQAKGPDSGRGEPVVLQIDRDADSRGIYGLLERMGGEYVKGRQTGRPVAVATPGTGTTTAGMPLVQVGNVPYQGTGPLKYANAEIGRIEITWPGGSATVDNGGELTVPAGTACQVTVHVVNTGEATWLRGGGRGGCALHTDCGDAPLAADLPRYHLTTVGPLTVQAAQRTVVTGRVQAEGIGSFGEVLRLTIVTR